MDIIKFLEEIYNLAKRDDADSFYNLDENIVSAIKSIVDNEETNKGVFTCVISSLTYKTLHPEQDVRFHKIDLPNGYSGRSFDTKYVTPFLKTHNFAGAMKESGWLTRSIEQDAPFDKNFPGKIQRVKSEFLLIFDYTFHNPNKARDCLLCLLHLSIIENNKRNIMLINPVDKENQWTINEIVKKLQKHFYYNYKSRGASILPVIAIYSIYQCIIHELKRFDNMYLDKLGSHNSCDKSSGATGDIVVRRKTDNSIYEVVEIKFDIPINNTMVSDAYKKISNKNVQRYYLLSTLSTSEEELVVINETISKIREEHGCQVIVNGVFPTIKYYLRLLENTDNFISNYVDNLSCNTELNLEHKSAWNTIIKNK